MPTLINGCGVWHYGRDHVHSHLATCEHCGQYTRLSSHDTGRYFCLLYVPLIPLGKLRIIDQCPLCKRMRTMKLAEWNRQKTEQVSKAVNEHLAAPADQDKAAAAIAATVFFEDESAFLGLTERIADTFAHDDKILAALAQGYGYFGYPDAAVDAYEQSLALKDDPVMHQRLALLLAHLKQPKQAEPHARSVLEDKAASNTGLLYVIAGTYLEQGQHAEAARLIDESLAAFPHLEKNKDWRKLRKLADKSSTRRLNVLPDIDQPVRSSRFGGKVAAIIGPAILLIAALIYLIVAASLGRHTVHVVNGLNRPYIVEIEGQTLSLAPHERKSLKLDEGAVLVHVQEANLGIADQSLSIHTSLLSRPFRRTTFIINPDQTALLCVMPIAYSECGDIEPDEPFRLLLGQALYALAKIDYPFQEPPNTLQIPEDGVVVKRQLAWYDNNLTLQEQVYVVIDEAGDEAAIDLLQRRICYDPEAVPDLSSLAYLMEAQAFLDFIGPHLDKPPLRIEWHRTYQSVVGSLGRKPQLIEQYRARLSADPDNTSLMYLLARIMQGDESTALLRQAAEGDPPCAFAYHGLAYQCEIVGDYQQAMQFNSRSRQLEPDNSLFEQKQIDLLHGAGLWQQLLDHPYSELEDADDYATCEWRCYLLAMMDRDDEPRQEIDQMAAQLAQNDYPPQEVNDWKARQLALLNYYHGNADAFISLTEDQQNWAMQFETALLQKRWTDAAELAKEDSLGLLLAASLAQLYGQTDIAKPMFDNALALCRDNDDDQITAAEWLSGEQAPDESSVRQLEMKPYHKSIVLLALGVRFPDQRDHYWPQAEKLNHDHRPPYFSLAAALAGK
ncbi:MAG: hypothetical protein IT445_04885 [Phycisphaeraceae bacterium]|nr:hypothetical protein [Phycisphaeraceae bacterium]